MHCVLHDRNIAMPRQDVPDLDMTTHDDTRKNSCGMR